MKKIILSVILVAGLCASIFGAAKKPQMESINTEIYSHENQFIEYTNLPQYEMLAIACRIAGIPGFTENYNGGYAYLGQIDSMADKYKDNKLVKLIKAANKKGVSCEGFVSLAYHIKPDFSSTTCDLDPKPNTLLYEWQKVSGKEIYAIVSALHDFAEETPFMKFQNLYRADYITVIQETNNNVNKYKTQEWLNDFFGYPLPVTVNFSFVNVGYNFYDFTTDSNAQEKIFITVYPYSYLQDMCRNYVMCYTQKLADSIWDEVKDNYKKYIMSYSKRVHPDTYDPKNFDNMSAFDLATLMSTYCLVEYVGVAFEEESPGIYEETKNAVYKALQDDNLFSVFDLIDEYKADRETYPTIRELAPKIADLINNLPVE